MFALFEDDFIIRYYNRRFPSVTSGYAEFAPFGEVYSNISSKSKIRELNNSQTAFPSTLYRAADSANQYFIQPLANVFTIIFQK